MSIDQYLPGMEDTALQCFWEHHTQELMRAHVRLNLEQESADDPDNRRSEGYRQERIEAAQDDVLRHRQTLDKIEAEAKRRRVTW